jgi:hypothetical protein
MVCIIKTQLKLGWENKLDSESFTERFDFPSIDMSDLAARAAFSAGGYIGAAAFYEAAALSTGWAKVGLATTGIAVELTFEGAAAVSLDDKISIQDAPGVIVAVVVSALTSPVIGIPTGVFVDLAVDFVADTCSKSFDDGHPRRISPG